MLATGPPCSPAHPPAAGSDTEWQIGAAYGLGWLIFKPLNPFVYKQFAMLWGSYLIIKII